MIKTTQIFLSNNECSYFHRDKHIIISIRQIESHHFLTLCELNKNREKQNKLASLEIGPAWGASIFELVIQKLAFLIQAEHKTFALNSKLTLDVVIDRVRDICIESSASRKSN